MVASVVAVVVSLRAVSRAVALAAVTMLRARSHKSSSTGNSSSSSNDSSSGSRRSRNNSSSSSG
eukprot:9493617-Pyramimonas_sp.AAC.1